MKQNNQLLILVGLLLAGFGATMRLLPHEPNLTPISAIAFVGSFYLGRRWGLLLPLAAIAISDLVLGSYQWQVMVSVYASFGLIGIIAYGSAQRRTVWKTGLSVASSSVLFFLITNAAVWYSSTWYEKSLSGLLYSYELGLPFFRNMLIGDFAYTGSIMLLAQMVVLFRKSYPFKLNYTGVTPLFRFSSPTSSKNLVQ
ncbi:hypothetical protein IPM19_01590 [bacterium]|nr:MAG: hypothetical protein IPM19_01590 [bacterium]